MRPNIEWNSNVSALAPIVFFISEVVTASGVGFSSNGYSIVRMGLTDTEHTRSTDGYQQSGTRFFNNSGQSFGSSRRYGTAGVDLGYSAWIYSGGTTTVIGFKDSEHTRDTDGWQGNAPRGFNESGHAIGDTLRFGAGGTDLGFSAWIYNGSSTSKLGFSDAEHVRDTDGYQYNSARILTESSQVAGVASRFGTGGTELGTSTWVYNGSSTAKVGLIDAEHTRQTDGYRTSSIYRLNEAGQAAGESQRYGAGGLGIGRSAWVYDGSNTVRVGLTDAEHTSGVGDVQINHVYRLNEAGQAAGHAYRFSDGAGIEGKSVWMFNGTSTVRIGLVDAEHTRDTDGYQYSYMLTPVEEDTRPRIQIFNEAGQAGGNSRRYATGGADHGLSAWVFDGNTTQNVGLLGTEYTRSFDGYRSSRLLAINEAGQAAGSAARFDAGGVGIGSTAWVYDGSTTQAIGLTDSEHTRITDGFRSSSIAREGDFDAPGNGESAALFNDGGQAAGYSRRYGVDGSDIGYTAWVYDGSNTVPVGLKGLEYTRNTDGLQINTLNFLNESGQAVGNAARWDASGQWFGQDAWFYDGDGSTSILGGLSEDSTGFAYSYVGYLDDDGLVLGTYWLYDEQDDYEGRAFAFSKEVGLFDLGLAVDETFDDWDGLRYAFGITEDGMIFGNGTLADGSASAYKLTPSVIPIPATAWLFGSALLGLGWFRGKKWC